MRPVSVLWFAFDDDDSRHFPFILLTSAECLRACLSHDLAGNHAFVRPNEVEATHGYWFCLNVG